MSDSRKQSDYLLGSIKNIDLYSGSYLFYDNERRLSLTENDATEESKPFGISIKVNFGI